jgi:hypothetical protein
MQRMTMATLAGEAAIAAGNLFEQWRAVPDAAAVDRFCADLRENCLVLPVVYYTEWVDRWLMGDKVPGPGVVEGRTFQASCFTPAQARAWADQCGRQFAEEKWLARRLKEAAAGWGTVSEHYAVVVTREVVGGSTLDEEVKASLRGVPAWLSRP